MISNLSDYFLPEQEIYLQSIYYNKLDMDTKSVEYSLNCTDNIQADVNDVEGVRLTITRTLELDPKGIFELSVAFGAALYFVEEKKEEYDWHRVNLAEEFKNNGGFVTDNLLNRITLQIAQITSSFGQTPLILPPMIANDIESDN